MTIRPDLNGQQEAISDAIEWLVKDARYLARRSRIYRQEGNARMAELARANATHSLNLARTHKEKHGFSSFLFRAF